MVDYGQQAVGAALGGAIAPFAAVVVVALMLVMIWTGALNEFLAAMALFAGGIILLTHGAESFNFASGGSKAFPAVIVIVGILMMMAGALTFQPNLVNDLFPNGVSVAGVGLLSVDASSQILMEGMDVPAASNEWVAYLLVGGLAYALYIQRKEIMRQYRRFTRG